VAGIKDSRLQPESITRTALQKRLR